MARYFFDLVDGDEIVRDRIGVDLESVTAARERAQALAIEKVVQIETFWEAYDSREFHVRALGGQRVATIALRYVTA